MDDRLSHHLAQLGSADPSRRLETLRRLMSLVRHGLLPAVPRTGACNNHVHSTYSFSPYTPSQIAWKAYEAGLSVCGIVDHDTVAGVGEFVEACKIVGVVPTVGFELRVRFDGTPLEGLRFNNPDQTSVAYFPVHGVPLSALEQITDLLQPVRAARLERNRKMTGQLDAMLSPAGLGLDFERDVIPVSRWEEGGTITERHLLFAAGQKLIARCGRGPGLVTFLRESMNLPVSGAALAWLSDPENPYYDFDLTNLLKGHLSPRMYLPAEEAELPGIRETIRTLTNLGCIPTYTYLGDVRGASVTGDKRAQAFEDDILETLLQTLHSYGLRAVSSAPTRNAPDQVARLEALCKKYELLEVLGEDINQPRQPFVNTNLRPEQQARFHLAAWALAGHEAAVNADSDAGLFSAVAVAGTPELTRRISDYAAMGQKRWSELFR